MLKNIRTKKGMSLRALLRGFRFGQHTGDELLAVDGAEYSPVKAFKGKAGRTVKLTLRREAGGPELAREVADTAVAATRNLRRR